jgi:hypothetical protein
MFGAGDVIAQKVAGTDQSYDSVRTLRVMTHGAFVFAPVLTKWHPFLHRVVKIQNPYLKAAVSVGIDQTTFGPLFALPSYFVSVGLLSGRTPSEIVETLKESYPATLRTAWCFWPLFQTFNFFLVPVQFRILSINVAMVCWNTIMSVMNASKLVKGDHNQLEVEVLEQKL